VTGTDCGLPQYQPEKPTQCWGSLTVFRVSNVASCLVAHWVFAFLSRMVFHIRLAIFLTVALPPLAAIALFSQVSPLSEHVLFLVSTVPKVSGILHAYILVFAVVVIEGLLFWRWTRKRPTLFPMAWWLSWWVLLVLAAVAATLSLPHHPCSAIAFLALLGFVLLYPLRQLVLNTMEPAAFFQASWISFAVASFASLAIWLIWLAVGFKERVYWTNWRPPFRKLVSSDGITWELAFIAWIAPLGIAIELGVAALLCWMRRQHLVIAAEGPKKLHFIISAVKQLSLWLATAALVCWLYAGLAAARDTGKVDQPRVNLQDEVLAMAFWIFVFTVAWTLDTIGLQEVEMAAAESKVVQETLVLMQGDWAKAFILVIGAVPMGICACIDNLRRGDADRRKALLAFTASWSWTSIIVKATLLGLMYVGCVVGFAKFTTVLLAFANEALADWPLFTVSLIMFLLGFSLFMFPPAPGAPIYIVMGIIVTSSALRQHWPFEAALAWATFVTFAMKLAFTAAAQKCIGEPLAHNETIRRVCELHTPYMRALEAVMLQEGLTFAKVTVLVGGPDWPVAVLCGMLRLPVLQVLAGVAPVLVQSCFPCVLAGALMLTEKKESDDDGIDLSLGEVMLMLAGILQAAAGLMAFFFVQEVLERDYDLLTVPRPEDETPLELKKKQTEEELLFWKQRDWKWLSQTMRSLLIAGFITMEASIIMLNGPWKRLIGHGCFKKFGLTDSVKHDLGGDPFGIILPMGWAALILSVVSSVCLGVFHNLEPHKDIKDESLPLSLSGM